MAQTIQLKRSSVAGNIPGTSDLALGEIAINTADGAVYIKTGNDDIVAVADDGILHIDTTNSRVGIGTTSPGTQLHVQMPNLSAGTGNGIRITDDSAVMEVGLRKDGSGNRRLAIFEDGGTYPLALQEDGGNVGIGTTSPSGLLSLEKGTRTLDVKLETTPASGDVGVQFRAGAGDYIGLAAGGGSGTGIVIDSSNNVGIGETSIDANLHITHTNPNLKFEIAGSGKWAIGMPTGQTYLAFDETNDSLTTPTMVMTKTTKRVGIGTTSPDELLHVEGNFKVQNGYINLISSYPRIYLTDSGNNPDYQILNDNGVFSILDGTNSVHRLRVASTGITFNNAYTFPTADGSANQVLQTDGSGNLSFATVSGGGGVTISNNVNNRVLTGDGTNANAEANLTFDGSTLALTGDMTITDTSTDPFLKLATSEREFVVRIDNDDSDKFQIRDVTASATRLSIDSTGLVTTVGDARVSGNLGVGRAPDTSFDLDVNGTSKFRGATTHNAGIQISNTTVIDSSRNLTNIGTISSGAITSSGDMAIDTDTLFVDVSADRVGINAGTSPSYSLHVSGDIYSSDTVQTKEFQNIKVGDASTPANTAGWFKIARVDRGTGRINLSFTGGNYSPTTYEIIYFKNWSTLADLQLNQHGSATHITSARIRQDSSDSIYYVEIYCASDTNGKSFQVYHKQLDGYFDGDNAVYTGSLTAGSASGTTYREADFVPRGRYFTKLETDDIELVGTSPQLLIPAHSGIEIDITGSASSGNIRANTDLYLLSQTGSINLGANGTNSILSINTSGNTSFTGNVSIADSQYLYFGASNDFFIQHNTTNTILEGTTGDIIIQNNATDKDIVFKSDDGSGGMAEYFRLDGSLGYTVSPKHILFNDNAKARFGDAGDLDIYHNGSHSNIQDTGTGNLRIAGSIVEITKNDFTETMAKFTQDGAVELYHNNSKKFETKSDGVDITGELQSDSLDVDGNADISGNLVLSGNLTVNGTTVTNSATNTTIEDALIELGSGNTGANSNDLGLILERGTTGNNVFIGWDESTDKVAFGTTTATGSSTGAISYSRADILASSLDLSNHIDIADSGKIRLGNSDDMQLYHNGTDSYIVNNTGTLVIDAAGDILADVDGGDVVIRDGGAEFARITNSSTNFGLQAAQQDKDIVFLGNDGGSTITALTLDMSDAGAATFNHTISSGKITADTGETTAIPLQIGSSSSTSYTLQRWITSAHSGTEAYIIAYGASNSSQANHFAMKNIATGGEIFFELASGVEPLRLTSTGATFAGDIDLADSKKIKLGAGDDLQLFHNGSSSVIRNETGHLDIKNGANDADIRFMCDDGSGGETSYFILDGSQAQSRFLRNVKWDDSIKALFGESDDLQLQHNGTDSFIDNLTGDFYITNKADDKDIIIRTDDGSGGFTTYMQFDGSNERTLIYKNLTFQDDIRARFGASNDMQIYHDGSNSYIANNTGNLQFDAANDIIIDAGGGDVAFRDDSVEFGRILNTSGSMTLHAVTQDTDILFRGNDGGSTITALTLDMSNAGAATFNSGITTSGAITAGAAAIGNTGEGHAIGHQYKKEYWYDESVGDSDGDDDKWTLKDSDGNDVTSTSTNKVYRVRLVTLGTGTNTGSVWLADNVDAGGWRVKAVSVNATASESSNYPKLEVDSSVPKVSMEHTSNYTVRIFVEEYDTGNNGGMYTIFGTDALITYANNGARIGINKENPAQRLDVNGTIGINGTEIITTSRNLTNIGSISSGAITSSGTSTFGTLNATEFDGHIEAGANLDINVGSNYGTTTTPDRLWISSFNTGQSDVPGAYYDIINLSTSSTHGVQIASGYGSTAGLFYMRNRSDNSNSPAGVGLQAWKRLYHEDHHPEADTLTTARTIGGVSFDGSANIDLPGVNTAGNQNTSGTAAGLSGTPNITVGTISSGAITSTGSSQVANLTVTGDLTVQGTTTTLETATLNVEDKNITLNYSSGDSSGSANGAGITIQDAVNSSTDATILWDSTNDEFDFSHSIKVAGSIGVTNIVTNKVVKFNGSTLDDSNITDTGSAITLGSNTTVSGNVTHSGLTMTSGTDIDQLTTTTVTATLSTSWQDTGINGNELASGTYIISVFVDDYAVGGNHYDELYSGVMSWHSGSTNSTKTDEILLHRAGHAPNNGDFFLRTQRHPVNGDNLMLQMRGSTSNSGNSDYIFKFRRMI